MSTKKIDIRNECGEALGLQCEAMDCEECEIGKSILEIEKESENAD